MGVLITGDFGARFCREHLLIPLPKEVEKNSDSQEVARLKKARGSKKLLQLQGGPLEPIVINGVKS